MTPVRRLFLALLVIGAALGSWTAPASAHAVVVATNPGDGQVLPVTPPQTTVQFSERVSIDLGGLTVLDADGGRVDDQRNTLNPSGTLLGTGLPDDLTDGTYVMTWRVVSADGHPISGSVVFGVGETTVIDAGGVAGLTQTGDTGLEVAAAAVRFIMYASALLAAGLAGFSSFVHDQDRDRWALARVVRGACVVAGLATIATIALQAALTTGRGLDAVTDASTLRAALAEGLGLQSVVSLIGLAIVYFSTTTTKLLTSQVLAFYGGLAVAVSFVFWGHARSAPNPVLAVSADVVHTSTAAIWFGGLVGLGLTLRRRLRHHPEADPLATSQVIGRFSTVAAFTIIPLLVAGTALAWQEVGSIEAYRTTTYGRVLLAKIAVVLAVLAVAIYNRFQLVPDIEALVADHEIPDPGRDGGLPEATSVTAVAVTSAPADLDQTTRAWARLASTVRLEALGVLVVLALTAALVYVTPARTASDQVPIVFNQTARAGELQVNLVVTPASVGMNALHIQYLDVSGRPVDQPQTLEIALSLPDKGVAPIVETMGRVAPGHFIAEDVQLPISGDWTVELVARLTDFEQTRTEFLVNVSP